MSVYNDDIILLTDGGYEGAEAVQFPVRVKGHLINKGHGVIVPPQELARIGYKPPLSRTFPVPTQNVGGQTVDGWCFICTPEVVEFEVVQQPSLLHRLINWVLGK